MRLKLHSLICLCIIVALVGHLEVLGQEFIDKLYIGFVTYERVESTEAKEVFRPIAVLYLENGTYKEAVTYDDEENCYSRLPELPLKFSAYFKGQRIGSFVAQERESVLGCVAGSCAYSGESSIDSQYFDIDYEEQWGRRELLAVYPGDYIKKTVPSMSISNPEQISEYRDTLLNLAEKLFKKKKLKNKKLNVKKFNMFYLDRKDKKPYIAGTIEGTNAGDSGLNFAFVVAMFSPQQDDYIPILQNVGEYGPEQFFEVIDFNQDGSPEIVTNIEGGEGHAFVVYSYINGKYKVVFDGGYFGC